MFPAGIILSYIFVALKLYLFLFNIEFYVIQYSIFLIDFSDYIVISPQEKELYVFLFMRIVISKLEPRILKHIKSTRTLETGLFPPVSTAPCTVWSTAPLHRDPVTHNNHLAGYMSTNCAQGCYYFLNYVSSWAEISREQIQKESTDMKKQNWLIYLQKVSCGKTFSFRFIPQTWK